MDDLSGRRAAEESVGDGGAKRRQTRGHSARVYFINRPKRAILGPTITSARRNRARSCFRIARIRHYERRSLLRPFDGRDNGLRCALRLEEVTAGRLRSAGGPRLRLRLRLFREA